MKKDFMQYISDVILYYTPPIQAYSKEFPANWHDFVFGINKFHSCYGYFVANLFNLKIEERRIEDFGRIIRQFSIRPCDFCHTKYAVITLNYDLVLENFCEFINNNYKNEGLISFNREGLIGDWTLPPLSKLHGSADHGVIVPPTWAKGTTPQVTPTWKNAFQILSESNHIRLIGYSLPIADAYIKYLLKSAVLKTKHLKSIDVICLDPDNSVKTRYKEFIKFDYFRFANINTDEYLKLLHDTNKGKTRIGSEKPFSMNVLEEVHENFMTTNSQ